MYWMCICIYICMYVCFWFCNMYMRFRGYVLRNDGGQMKRLTFNSIKSGWNLFVPEIYIKWNRREMAVCRCRMHITLFICMELTIHFHLHTIPIPNITGGMWICVVRFDYSKDNRNLCNTMSTMDNSVF